MGLLDMLFGQQQQQAPAAPVDPQLAAIMAQVNQYSQPTPQDRQAAQAAQFQAYMASLIGARKGLEGDALRQGGLLSMQAYQNAIHDAAQRRSQTMAQMAAAMNLKTQMQALQDQEDVRKANMSVQPFNPQAAAMAAAPSLSPTVANVANVQAQAANVGGGGADGQEYARLRDRAMQLQEAARRTGSPAVAAAADAAWQAAEKFAPQYDGTETAMMNGVPTLVQKYKNRAPTAVQGFQPKPETVEMSDNATKYLVDRLTGAQVGPAHQMQMTPNESFMAPVELARLKLQQGQLGVAQGNLGVNQARLGIERENQNIRRTEVDPMGFLGLNKAGAAAGAPTAGAPTPVAGAIAGGKTGDEFLATLPPALAAQVKGLSNGDIPFPSSFALKSPYWQGMISLVTQYDPTFDAINYGARAKVRADMTSGKSAQSINAINTTIGHMADLYKSAEALNNTDYPIVNRVINAVGGQVSPDLKGRVNAYNTQVQAVVSEMERVYRQAGGSTRDIEEWKKNFDSADSLPAQRAAINAGIGLLNSKLNALADQYNKGMGTTKDGLQMLSPKAQQIVDQLSNGAPAAGGGKVIDFNSLPK